MLYVHTPYYTALSPKYFLIFFIRTRLKNCSLAIVRTVCFHYQVLMRKGESLCRKSKKANLYKNGQVHAVLTVEGFDVVVQHVVNGPVIRDSFKESINTVKEHRGTIEIKKKFSTD